MLKSVVWILFSGKFEGARERERKKEEKEKGVEERERENLW